MKKLLLLAGLLVLSSPALAQQTIQGNVPDSSTDAGAPVKVACLYTSAAPTYTSGQRANCQADTRGNQRVTVSAPNSVTNISDTTGIYNVSTAHATLGGATVRSTSSAEATAGNLVIKASAGNLYDWDVVGGAGAGFFMIFNSATVPADGAVTPITCVPVAIGAFVSGTPAVVPSTYGTGISVAYSSTGCFTKTTAAVGFIRISYK